MNTSDWIATAAVIVSVVLFILERHSRTRDRRIDLAAAHDESLKRATLEGTVTELRRNQNDILDAMSETIRAAVDPAARQKLGAAISLEMIRVRFVTPAHVTDNEYLVVKNLGPGGATVTRLDVITPGAEKVLLDNGPDGLIPGGVQELEPGEQFYVQAIRVMGGPPIIEVVATFTDGTGEHQRRRDLGSAP